MFTFLRRIEKRFEALFAHLAGRRNEPQPGTGLYDDFQGSTLGADRNLRFPRETQP